jgi:hypothetical protein
MKNLILEKTRSLPLKSDGLCPKEGINYSLLQTLNSNDKFSDINSSLARIASHRSSNTRNKSDTTNTTAERLLNFQSFIETSQNRKNSIVSHKYTLSTCGGVGLKKIKNEIKKNIQSNEKEEEKMEFAKYFSRNITEKEVEDKR